MKARHLLAILAVVSQLTSCMAPPQDFPVGSELWEKANPQFEGSQLPNKDRFQVLVGVLDAGIDYNSKRLRDHIVVFKTPARTGRGYGVGFDVLGKDYFPSYRIIKPKDGSEFSNDLMMDEHGSHVAQLIALNDKSIGLIPVRVFPLAAQDSDKQGVADPEKSGRDPVFLARVAHRSVDAIARGLQFAVAQGASIINLSLGLTLDELKPEDQRAVLDHVEEKIVSRMTGTWKHCLMVVASGNESRKLERVTQAIPATLSLPTILSVGALKDSGTIAYYSNHGRFVDVYARGTDIKSAVPAGMTKLSGTSMAAPLVAHAAAQLKAIDPSLTAVELRALIMNTADKKILPFEGHEKGYKETPPPQKARVLNILAARKRAQWLLSHPEARQKWLTPPHEHGAAPR